MNQEKSYSTDITGGQPTITRLLGKMSVIPLGIQTEMRDGCPEGRLEKGIRLPSVEPKILGAQADFKAQEIGLHPVPVGSRIIRKVQITPPVEGMVIQAKPPDPAETKEMPKDPRARVKETRLGPLLQAMARGVAAVEVPHQAPVAVEGVIIVCIRPPVQITCQMQTEVPLKMP